MMGTTSVGGKLAVLTPGLGAVATTVFAGVEAVRNGWARPIGSLTQMGKLPVTTEALDRLVFGGWDIFPDTAYESARHARVLETELLEKVRPALDAIRPMSAVFDPAYVRRLSGPNVKTGPNKRHLAEQLRTDIRTFMAQNGCSRAVMVWCASTEVYAFPSSVHSSLKAFERGLEMNDPAIAPSQIYAYAALKEGIPYANGSPNVSLEANALRELAALTGTAICGSDFKTGQTMIKTVIAPALKSRLLGVNGWFSTNILGNRDGEVLDDPGSFKSKEISKSGVLGEILSAQEYPELYSDLDHVVRICYYTPRGDNKEGWDNIDLFGWLGYPMQLKINFLCRDSILAAPIVLDLALLMDLASRHGRVGVQDWLSFYFKAPLESPNSVLTHDLNEQKTRLYAELDRLALAEQDVAVPAVAFA